MVQIFKSWGEYTGFISQNTEYTNEEALAHFSNIAAACHNPDADVLWLCTVCQVELLR
jgi:hypothetical protein